MKTPKKSVMEVREVCTAPSRNVRRKRIKGTKILPKSERDKLGDEKKEVQLLRCVSGETWAADKDVYRINMCLSEGRKSGCREKKEKRRRRQSWRS